MREFIPPATRFVDLPDGFPMKRGGTLHGARIGYETHGKTDTARGVVLLLTGLSADAHPASHPDDPSPGWWQAMLGPGKPIDTDHWYVICVNSLGSCKGSTGPASIDPSTGEPYRLDFPDLTMEDIADAAAYTVRALGFERLDCVIGSSMGGMSALALLARHPGIARSHINISGAVHSLPYSIALRSLQREVIRSDPHWDQGRYHAQRYPQRGMLIARKLGMVTYRSAGEWESRFGRARLSGPRRPAKVPFGMEFEMESYLEFHAHRFLHAFDPNSYLYLSHAMDQFDLAECCGVPVGDALSGLRLDKALVMGVGTDILFPLKQQQQIAEGLTAGGTDVQFLPLESPQGHDAFLIDTDRFGPPIAKFLSVGW